MYWEGRRAAMHGLRCSELLAAAQRQNPPYGIPIWSARCERTSLHLGSQRQHVSAGYLSDCASGWREPPGRLVCGCHEGLSRRPRSASALGRRLRK